MFRSFVLACLGLVCLSSGAGAVEAFPAECRLTLAASLPITMARGHITVPVRVNGILRSFAIDTGGFASSITQAVVSEQNLKTYGIHHAHLRDIGGNDAELYASVDTLLIGNQKDDNARLMVMDTGGLADGLIAPDLLRNFDVEIDFANAVVNLFRPHPCSGRAVYWTDDYFTLPMDVTEQGHIRVDVMLDGKPMRALVDTGSPATLIGKDTAQSDFKVDQAQGNVENAAAGTMTGSSGGAIDAVPHRFTSLQLGGINIKNPVLLLASSDRNWRDEYSGLLLGMRDLRNFHLYVSYRERKLYLSRANAGAADQKPAPKP